MYYPVGVGVWSSVPRDWALLGQFVLSGDDVITGSNGDDVIPDSGGNDTIDGRGGNDTISYEFASGGQTVHAGYGKSVGAAGTDTLYSIENVIGSPFDDIIYGSQGVTANSLIGGAGNDQFLDLADGDQIDGGTGVDTVSYDNSGRAVSARLDIGRDAGGNVFVNIESLTGSRYNDLLVGNNRINVLLGGDGNDILNGLGANDTIAGGAGKDTLIGGPGADALDGGAGGDTASYANAASRVDARLIDGRGLAGHANGDTYSGIEHLIGSRFNDKLFGDNGVNLLLGGNGNDILSGFDGRDVLNGGRNADLLTGGAGVDLLNGSTGTDTANYSNAPGRVDARLINARGYVGDANGDRYISIENLGGSNFDDLLVGHNENNTLVGRAGPDNINGLGGDDVLSGGGGDDRLTGGTGDDLLFGGTGNDLFVFRTSDGVDRIADFLAGPGLGDRIFINNGAAPPDAFGDLSLTQAGANTVIDLGGGDQIILLGVVPADLAADDFLF